MNSTDLKNYLALLKRVAAGAHFNNDSGSRRANIYEMAKHPTEVGMFRGPSHRLNFVTQAMLSQTIAMTWLDTV